MRWVVSYHFFDHQLQAFCVRILVLWTFRKDVIVVLDQGASWSRTADNGSACDVIILDRGSSDFRNRLKLSSEIVTAISVEMNTLVSR